ncbi:hypothetical protein ACSVDA_11945 [Cytobacillus sp. Hm23]
MGLVSLVERGFIYEDDFSSGVNSRWEMSPNSPSRLSHDGEKLNIFHGNNPLYLFLNELTDTQSFVFDVQNTYNPSDGGVGGITAYGDRDNFIAVEEYFDSESGVLNTFPWIRLVRDYKNYFAYWSEDGVEWHTIGSSSLDAAAPKIGLFVEGTSENPLGVEKVRVFSSTEVSITNLLAGMKVSLVDGEGAEIKSQICREHDNKVVFDVADLPFPFNAKIVIDTGADILDSNSFINIYGGDVYYFEVTPDILFYMGEAENPISLTVNTEEFLGHLATTNMEQECEVIIRNPLPGTFSDIQINLVPYENDDHWDRLVDIADDEDGSPGEWRDAVNIPELLSGNDHKVWVKLKREFDETKYTSSVYFGLKVFSSYDL